MTMSLVCTSTNTISKQEHMATPSLNDQPFIDTTKTSLMLKVSFISNRYLIRQFKWKSQVLMMTIYRLL
jgi:hypothetical protein